LVIERAIANATRSFGIWSLRMRGREKSRELRSETSNGRNGPERGRFRFHGMIGFFLAAL